MIRMLIGYFLTVTSLASRQWERFWFTPGPTFDIGITRAALGIFAAVYAASWLFDLHDWIRPDGSLDSSVTRFLIGDRVAGTGSMGRLSLLYRFESEWSIQAYLIVTVLCTLAMAVGLGGRVMAALAWILTLGIVHRVPMLQGAGDLLLTGIMGYLVIDPGKTRNWWRIGLDDRIDRWPSNLAIRLMQAHVVIWLVISFASHLAEPMWWSGSAAWWLASAQLSPWFSQFFLSDKPYLINLLSHGFLIVHLMTLGLLLLHPYRPLAIAASLLMAIGVWGLAGDWTYSLALVLCLSPFWGQALREFRGIGLDEESSTDEELSELSLQPSFKKSKAKRPVLRNSPKNSA